MYKMRTWHSTCTCKLTIALVGIAKEHKPAISVLDTLKIIKYSSEHPKVKAKYLHEF